MAAPTSATCSTSTGDGRYLWSNRARAFENRISSKATFSGEIDIVAKVNSDGTIAFAINGDSKTTGKSQLLKSHPQEHLDIGFDAGNPVDKKAPAGNFNGQIHQVEVTTGDKK